MTIPTPVLAWLAAWQQAIRDRDYPAGRALFDEGVLSFGTRSARMSGLEQLVREQWLPVWERTKDFQFDLDRCAVVLRVDDDHCVIAVPWTSVGIDHNGDPLLLRSGRATLVLTDSRGALRCVHSHLSIDPPPVP